MNVYLTLFGSHLKFFQSQTFINTFIEKSACSNPLGISQLSNARSLSSKITLPMYWFFVPRFCSFCAFLPIKFKGRLRHLDAVHLPYWLILSLPANLRFIRPALLSDFRCQPHQRINIRFAVFVVRNSIRNSNQFLQRSLFYKYIWNTFYYTVLFP